VLDCTHSLCVCKYTVCGVGGEAGTGDFEAEKALRKKQQTCARDI
jgi:hypothetical protein